MMETSDKVRHGRRARRLTPEEQAVRAAADPATAQHPAVPSVRGAVTAPGADAPVPMLRKFGKRARIIELLDPSEVGQETGAPQATAAPPVEEAPTDVLAPIVDSDADPSSDLNAPSDPDAASDATGAAVDHGSAAASVTATAVSGEAPIRRDVDGVELGEMSVTEAPSPKPAPRFEGNVLHRPERAGGRPLLWLVWALVAIAVIVLVILLVTGVLGPADGSNAAAHTTIDSALPLLASHPFLEDLFS